MNLPIQLTEQKIDEKWEPEVGQTYIIEYEWNNWEKWWLIGQFYPVWYGYTFHWPWSASSLQLSITGKGAMKVENDWKQFKRVYLFEPYPEPDFIEKGEIEICDCEGEICGICSHIYCDHNNCKCVELNMR